MVALAWEDHRSAHADRSQFIEHGERLARERHDVRSLHLQDRKSTRLNSSHSLRDTLPIYGRARLGRPSFGPCGPQPVHRAWRAPGARAARCAESSSSRSEEHTSELQSLPTRHSSDLWSRSPGKTIVRPMRTAASSSSMESAWRESGTMCGVFIFKIGRAHV